MSEFVINKASWETIMLAITHCPRVLLTGRPGIGKTSVAVKCLRDLGYETEVMSLTEGDFSQSIFGRERLDGKGGMEFIPSVAVKAASASYKTALILNEINRASLEVLSALYPFCDVGPSAEVVLPNNKRLKLQKDFKVIATMNGNIDELPEGLRGRFPVAFQIDQIHPQLLMGLNADIRKLALDGQAPEKGSGVRIWHTFQALVDNPQIGLDQAVEILWGKDAGEAILDSLRVGRT